MRIQTVTEYLLPLREGGSLPAVVRADDHRKYVIKFSGAGQGVKALIADFIGGELARLSGFKTPELLLLELDPVIAKAEPDPEIQDLLKASAGINLGMEFIEQAATFSPNAIHVSENFASEVVWLDAFITNVDRTARNVNMLIQDESIWLIDHGASLNFHYNWRNTKNHAENSFPLIKDHVLLKYASELNKADKKYRELLKPTVFQNILNQIPDAWLATSPDESPELKRQGYFDFFNHRLNMSHLFVREAVSARSQII
ncbi:MAG: aminotransferase class I and II [Calditrichae bacterium]|nr:aminotransferase class I and II [Calditrichia bacterium]